MSAPKVDVLADGLRRLCGHDSRSVDGCVTCEAADSLEDGERRNAAVAELIGAGKTLRQIQMHSAPWYERGIRQNYARRVGVDTTSSRREIEKAAEDRFDAALARIGGGV